MPISEISPRLVNLAARAATSIEPKAAPADTTAKERREQSTARVAEILSTPTQGKLRLDAEALSVVQSISDARSADGVFAGISRLREIVAGLKPKSRYVPVTDLFGPSATAVNASNAVRASGAVSAAEPASRTTVQDEAATSQPTSAATTNAAGVETSGANAPTSPQTTAAEPSAPAEEPVGDSGSAPADSATETAEPPPETVSGTEQPSDDPAPAETTTSGGTETPSSTTPPSTTSSGEGSSGADDPTLATVVESTQKGNAFGLLKK
jgi:hypothetical protein